MEKLNSDKQLQGWLRHAVNLPASRRTRAVQGGHGLYIRLHGMTPQWLLRYQFLKKSRVMVIGHYPELTLSSARTEAAKARVLLDLGNDPATDRRNRLVAVAALNAKRSNTVATIAESWINEEIRPNHRNPEKVVSTVKRYITDMIGSRSADEVTGDDVKKLLKTVKTKGGPTVANDVLRYLGRMYNRGNREKIISSNPTWGIRLSDAGGEESARDRTLDDTELRSLFKAAANNESFTRSNEIAAHLLLLLCPRKMELCAATWAEFDFNEGLWAPRKRSRLNSPGKKSNKRRLQVPLSSIVVRLLEEQRVFAGTSEYVFPVRRITKKQRAPHVSPSTLNAALSKLRATEERFTVHDLRRTSRTLLSRFRTPFNIGELCLGHWPKGASGAYDVWAYLDERREALAKLESHYISLGLQLPDTRRWDPYRAPLRISTPI